MQSFAVLTSASLRIGDGLLHHPLRSSALLGAFSLLLFGTARANPSIRTEFSFPGDGDMISSGVLSIIKATIIGYKGIQDSLIQDPTIDSGYVLSYLSNGLPDSVLKDPSPATVTFLDPADYSVPNIYVFKQSTLKMTGGRIRGEVDNYGSTVTLGDTSSLDQLLVSIGGTVNVDGGTIGNPIAAVDAGSGLLDAAGDAQVHMTKGFVGTISLNGMHTKASITGGTLNRVLAQTGAFATINDGLVRGNVESLDDTTFVGINGGQIKGSVFASSSGTAIVNGGNVAGALSAFGGNVTLNSSGSVGGDLYLNGNGTALMDGGNLAGNAVSQSGVMTISGGAVAQNAEALGISPTEFATINVTGGVVQGNASSENNSLVAVSGDADILGDLITEGNGQIGMTGGTVGGVSANGSNSVVRLSGGLVQQDALTAGKARLSVLDSGHVGREILASENSQVTISGGQVGKVGGLDHAHVLIFGGSVGPVLTQGSSFLMLTGGSVVGDVAAFESSSMDLSGGSINGNVDAHDSTLVVVEGTTVSGKITAHDQASLLILQPLPSPPGGGALHALPSGDSETGDSARGGPVLAKLLGAAGLVRADAGPANPLQIFLYDDSTLEIDGFNFSAALLDPNNNNMFSEYQLSGFFANGSPFGGGLGIQLFVQNGTAASFKLVEVAHVPEPSGIVLLASMATLLGLVRRRRI
jgi:hypothetical protein